MHHEKTRRSRRLAAQKSNYVFTIEHICKYLTSHILDICKHAVVHFLTDTPKILDSFFVLLAVVGLKSDVAVVYRRAHISYFLLAVYHFYLLLVRHRFGCAQNVLVRIFEWCARKTAN